MGRQSVFRNKKGGMRVQAFLTPQAAIFYKQMEAGLARMTGRPPDDLSVGDVVEFALRGEANTRDYLAGIAK